MRIVHYVAVRRAKSIFRDIKSSMDSQTGNDEDLDDEVDLEDEAEEEYDDNYVEGEERDDSISIAAPICLLFQILENRYLEYISFVILKNLVQFPEAFSD